jgi:hypothetical protein
MSNLLSLFFGQSVTVFKHNFYIKGKYSQFTRLSDRIKFFFKPKQGKKGSILLKVNEPVKLVEFIKFNNVGDEFWRIEYINYPQLGSYNTLVIDNPNFKR